MPYHQPHSPTLDKMLLRVAKIETFNQERPLTNATGFFFLHGGFLFLVTSRHVVINEAMHHRPDTLQLSLHTDAANLEERADLQIPLYQGGVPQWCEHPRYADRADVVAVAINDPHVLASHFVETFCDAEILGREQVLPLGQDVLILGFPLGFHDTLHNLPLIRRATIASSYSHPFKGEPYFLTEARLHRGMSGSPVFVPLPLGSPVTSNGIEDSAGTGWGLLGIHSSSLDVSNRDPKQDEPLGLNTTWYASLLPEMLPVS